MKTTLIIEGERGRTIYRFDPDEMDNAEILEDATAVLETLLRKNGCDPIRERKPAEVNRILDHGFVAFNGVKWADNQVDFYNYLTKEIANNPSEELQNQRHKMFCVFSNLYV